MWVQTLGLCVMWEIICGLWLKFNSDISHLPRCHRLASKWAPLPLSRNRIMTNPPTTGLEEWREAATMPTNLSFINHSYLYGQVAIITLVTSEVTPKLIFMGHPISSCHAPVVSSFIMLFKTLVSSLSICYVHLVKHKLITLYCPKFSPNFVKWAICTVLILTCTVQKSSSKVPIATCTYPKFNLSC